MADPLMQHPDDLKVEKNFYICPKDEYYCKEIHGTKVTRHLINKRKKSRDPFIKSSLNTFKGKDQLNTSNKSKYQKLSALQKFILFFIRRAFTNQVFVAHNSSNFDSILLIEGLTSEDITPSVLSKGNKLLCISINEFNIQFIDSIRYIKASLAKCCKVFKLSEKKGTFPLKANHRDYYNKNGIVPQFHLFINENDSQNVIEEKKQWYQNRKQSLWNFKKEIAAYCTDDSLILCKIGIKFAKEWFDIQVFLICFFLFH